MAALLVAVGTSYHVDPRQGDDHSSGTSPGHAWRTLLPLSKVHLRPGDRLLIAAGTTLAGPLRLNGTENLLVASYGNGHATIDGGAGDGIVADGGKNLRIRDLTLIASGRKANDGRGISLENILSATIERVDVSGYRLAGIEITGSKRITVSHVVAHDNGAAGIAVSGGKEGLSRSSDITIRPSKRFANPRKRSC
ncbi:right-handed parallel beta-helix repeat-containing protein [bacterium]|nr:MAG: right-handed parallel beta-helix repeat-containing protein [bacterium]